MVGCGHFIFGSFYGWCLGCVSSVYVNGMYAVQYFYLAYILNLMALYMLGKNPRGTDIL